MKVLLTVDTEFWPRQPGFDVRIPLEQLDIPRYVRRDIHGATPRGGFGVPLQMELMNAHGLRGVFFLEALFASVVGVEPLREIVSLIQGAGHEVQLHLHTEWLRVDPNRVLPGREGIHIRNFSLDEQESLLARGRDNLHAAGARPIRAYRAGNFGANAETLKALARIGIPFDSSHNAAFLGSSCHLPTERPLRQPERLEGVWELPVACFEDRPGHDRPAQVNACSASEMKHALLAARAAGWPYFVVVTHSNELLNRRGDGPNPVVVSRFRSLCRFLGEHRDEFQCVTFDDIDPDSLGPFEPAGPVRSNAWRTAVRIGEQVVQRWLY